MRLVIGSLIVLAWAYSASGQAWHRRPWTPGLPGYQVVRDGNGYAQWPHQNHDGITTAPAYKPEHYPGPETPWSVSSSEDPKVVEHYRRVLEEYDRIHGTHKNPYPPLPQSVPVQAPVTQVGRPWRSQP